MRERRKALCYPHAATLRLIASSGLPVAEIGAGEGLWARALIRRGVSVLAYDRQPRGEGVTAGDHLDAARDDHALLAVWPPDGTAVQTWINAAHWREAYLIAHPLRIAVGDALHPYCLIMEIQLPAGRKGAPTLWASHRL